MNALAIQAMIDAAGQESTVRVPAGTYDVDALNAPIKLNYRSALTLDLTLAVLKVIPNQAIERMYWVIQIASCDDVEIIGGTLIGDRPTHAYSPAAMGMGIVIGAADKNAPGSKNIKLRHIMLKDFQGDGVLVRDAEGLELDALVCDHNGRQGLSVSKVNGLWVHDGVMSNTGGVEPGAGIDLEVDLPIEHISNARIERMKFFGNHGAGVLVSTPPAQRHNINVMPDCSFSGKPVDGTDGIVPWWAKLIGPYTNWYGYPRELHLP